MVKGGGVQIEIQKNPGIDFYSGFRKNDQGGGVQIEILLNAGIDFHSGFRKTLKGGRVQFEILRKYPPPPNLKAWIRHCSLLLTDTH